MDSATDVDAVYRAQKTLGFGDRGLNGKTRRHEGPLSPPLTPAFISLAFSPILLSKFSRKKKGLLREARRRICCQPRLGNSDTDLILNSRAWASPLAPFSPLTLATHSEWSGWLHQEVGVNDVGSLEFLKTFPMARYRRGDRDRREKEGTLE